MDEFTTALLVIAAIGIGYALMSIAITNRFGNRGRVKEIQKRMNEIVKEQQEALKKSDETRASALGAEQMSLMTESLKLQGKQMLIIIPLFILISYCVNAFVKPTFAAFSVILPFHLPVPYFKSFPLPTIIWRNEFGVFGWFIISAVFSGIIASIVMGRIKKPSEIKK